MKKKLDLIRKTLENENYLRETYTTQTLHANRDGEVEFDRLLEWLHANQQEVGMMIEMANNIEKV